MPLNVGVRHQGEIVHTSKRPTYEETIRRIDRAISERFFLEATWIVYSLFEDRCNSALEKTGGRLSNPRASIEQKLKALEARSGSNPSMGKVTEFPAIFNEVRVWKDARNPLMHEMVDMPRPWTDINNDAEALALDGRELLGRFTSAMMKLRKHVKKS